MLLIVMMMMMILMMMMIMCLDFYPLPSVIVVVEVNHSLPNRVSQIRMQHR